MAVVFELPDAHWPVIVHLELTAAVAVSLMKSFLRSRVNGLHLSADNVAYVREAAAAGVVSDLEVRADHSRALGTLVRRWLAADAVAWTHFDESIEVVVAKPVPARASKKLVPLSQTNANARSRREGQRGSRSGSIVSARHSGQ